MKAVKPKNYEELKIEDSFEDALIIIDKCYAVIALVNGIEWIRNFYEFESDAISVLNLLLEKNKDEINENNNYYIKTFVRMLDEPIQIRI